MLEKYTLKNGIPVFVLENHSAPVVAIQAWVSRGSAHETDKLAGISHFLEHALFKGTKHRRVGEIAKEIEGHGGEVNAFTSFEETAYYTTLASRYFEEGIDVIADAIQFPSFDSKEMEREKEVILEEIKRAHDSPGRMVSTNLWKTCFSGTPFGRPVLGFEETVAKIGSAELKTYFKKNYHAGSVSLFIVGDVEKAHALSLAAKKLSRMKKGSPNNPKIRFPTLKNPQWVTVERDIQQCQIQIGFSVPSITHASTPAMDMLCSTIGQGESSRLYQRLVKEKHLALDTSMGLVATSFCGMATIGLVAPPEKAEEAIEESFKVLSEVCESGLEEVELDRVRNSLESEVVSGKETVDGYARRLGYYYVQFGDPSFEKKYLDKILAVGGEDILSAAHSLSQKQPAVSAALPMGKKLETKNIRVGLKSERKRSLAVPPTFEAHKRDVLGVPFVSRKVVHLPIVSMKFIFDGGSKEQNVRQWGLTTLFERLWGSATRSYGVKELAHLLDSLGADLSGFAGRNSHGVDAEFLSKQWPILRPILSELLTEPSFPDEEFETQKAILLREIQSERDMPGQMCNLGFSKAMYGEHPYGRSSLGTVEGVTSLRPEDLRRFFKEYVHRGKLVVSAVGCFPQQDWAKELEPLLNLLPPRGKIAQKLATPSFSRTGSAVIQKKAPLFQTHLLVGFPGTTFLDEDRYGLKLLSSALAGQGGRLFMELRDRQSLAYTVAPVFTEGPIPGVLAFYIGCSSEKWKASLQGIRSEIEKVCAKPMSQSELKRAKEYWIGRFELDLQRYGSQAALLGLDEFYGLGFAHGREVPERIKKVTADEIKRAAEKYLKVESPIISMVHNEALTEEEVLSVWGKKPTRSVSSSPTFQVDSMQ